MRDLFAAYTASEADLQPFFSRSPRTLLVSPPPDALGVPTSLLDAIQEHNRAIGSAGVLNGGEFCIVTGQQPAIFSGPLYTIYKAATAIILARRFTAAFGKPCKPVFWSASDDHDFEEARSTYLLTRQHTPLELRYEPEGPVEDRPLSHVPVEPSLHDLVDVASANAPGSEFRDDVRRFLHDSLDRSAFVADWADRLLARLFQSTPLVHFRPDLAAARYVAADVLRREIGEPLTTTRLVSESADRLGRLGFQAQVIKRDNECCFFLFEHGRRRKVLFENGAYYVPASRQRYTIEEMLELLDTAPEQFSPNVVLRPVVQQRLFPVVAYVAGPGETAYWAQLRPVFEHYGLDMPIVYPRIQCTLTTEKLERLLARYGLRIDDLNRPAETILEDALRRVVHTRARDRLERARGPILDSIRALRELLADEDPPAGALAHRLEENAARGLDRIERAILRADQEQADAVQGHIERLQNTLRPWRRPQERVYTPFAFLFEHGWDLIGRILEELDPDVFTMQTLTL